MQTKKWLGGEWHPANASNSLWMAPKFFPSYMQGQVHAELKAAAAMGLTALRVFLHNMAYDADPKAFLAAHRAEPWALNASVRKKEPKLTRTTPSVAAMASMCRSERLRSNPGVK